MHIVFSTDERRPLIRHDMKIRLHAYLGGIARENSMVALAIGGIEDHVHVLLSLNRTIAVAKAVQFLKGCSSKWINDTFPDYGRFSWQEGYGAFSVSISQRDRTAAYIHNQVEHHKKFDFAEEFRRLLAIHGMQEEEFVSRP
jgi:REP element-mobilizing transposase RayT